MAMAAVLGDIVPRIPCDSGEWVLHSFYRSMVVQASFLYAVDDVTWWRTLRKNMSKMWFSSDGSGRCALRHFSSASLRPSRMNLAQLAQKRSCTSKHHPNMPRTLRQWCQDARSWQCRPPKNGGGRNVGAPLRPSRMSVAPKRGSIVLLCVWKRISSLSAQRERSIGRTSIAALMRKMKKGSLLLIWRSTSLTGFFCPRRLASRRPLTCVWSWQ